MDDPLLTSLDHVRHSAAVAALSPTIAALLRRLEDAPELPQAWQPLPIADAGLTLPPGIASAWLFALRGGAVFPSERHPNSWQRSIALQGRATFELYRDLAWRPHPLDGSGTSVAARAISIPPDVWHRITIGGEPFVSLSFHTVAAAELIEETCAGDDFSKTRRRLYSH